MNQPGRFNRFHAPAVQPGQQDMDDDFIDLGRLLHAVLRYKWGILGLAFAIALFAGLWVYTLQPVYRASASIVLEFDNNIVPSVDQSYYATGRRDYDYYDTQFEILKSRALAERVVRRLKLQDHPMFLHEPAEDDAGGFSFSLRSLLPAGKQEPPPQLTPEEEEEQRIQSVTDAIAGGLQVQPLEYSYMAYLTYDFSDPELAARIVNTTAEEFIKSDLEVRLAGTVQATDWLDSRMADLKANLEASEQALQEFREREGLVEVQGVTNLGTNDLQILAQRLDDARRARIEAQNIKEEVSGLGNASTEDLMTLPAVLEHELIRDLKRTQSGAERKVAELAKRYGPRHPVMIAARSDLDAANADLAREVRKVVSGIEREYELALRNEQELQSTFDASKSEIQDFNRVEFRLRELQREVDTNRELYDVFFERLKTVSETGGFEKPHARIVDHARVPSAPIKPNKKQSVILAFVLGIVLGCGVAILLDMLDNTVKGPDDVRDKLGVPLLGSLPKQKVDKEGDFEQVWQNPQSHYAEAIRTLRTSLLLSSPDKPAQVIVVTSTVPGEGKSTTVLNMACALGQMEKTLVIGADLRRPSLAKRCGLSPNHHGLSHFVADSLALDDCVEWVESLGIHVMPAGLIPPNPLELISSRRFREALDSLRERFDRIVIDSAPVQAVSDALVLASYADSVVYIVKAGDTSATAAHRGIAAVMANNEPLTGVVLNQFDPKKVSSYHGDSYYTYGDYYAADNA